MKKILWISIILFISCAKDKKEDQFLIKFYEGGFNVKGAQSGYVNIKGDTIIPAGKYECYTDTLRTHAIVKEKSGRIIGIDKKENTLFEVYGQNGQPDSPRDGLFRIIKDGKIGYANDEGNIVIAPLYKCAFPFFNGQARVAIYCQIKDNEGRQMMSTDQWIFIDTKGKLVEK
ncbi:WG repeat-containing protein [Leptobacterium flavescens]|uniref:WG repeat-containing protein n=1 Tax=Leptobacterium flavescens TaxID=472055 RepID=A0A6P0UQT2_9FLAO|nr:WG repeat-containing protein [Leptobacterium flavescens]NER12766.1 WG repeat-containing protein [Leptobacterium flavescens]